MKIQTYSFAPDVTDNQRDRIVIQLRRDGYCAYRDGYDHLRTDATQGQVQFTGICRFPILSAWHNQAWK